jgi:hypothetical protein
VTIQCSNTRNMVGTPKTDYKTKAPLRDSRRKLSLVRMVSLAIPGPAQPLHFGIYC